MQTPPLQMSEPLQKSPSSQEAVLGGLEQPTPAVQMSSVQTLPSLQRALFGVPAQTPPVHTSVTVQAMPSSHPVPSGWAGFEHVPVSGSQAPSPWH